MNITDTLAKIDTARNAATRYRRDAADQRIKANVEDTRATQSFGKYKDESLASATTCRAEAVRLDAVAAGLEATARALEAEIADGAA